MFNVNPVLRCAGATTLLAFVLAAITAYAEIPRLISYQGRLLDSGGQPVDTITEMTFVIYDDTTGAGPLWQEIQDSVQVVDGLFSVLLGSVVPIPADIFTVKVAMSLQKHGITLCKDIPVISVDNEQALLRMMPLSPPTFDLQASIIAEKAVELLLDKGSLNNAFSHRIVKVLPKLICSANSKASIAAISLLIISDLLSPIWFLILLIFQY